MLARVRKLRPPVPGIFHVATRSVDQRPVFMDEYGCLFFLGLLARIVDRLAWSCWSYCLLDTHYHLVVEAQHGNLSEGMQFLNGSYAQRYNKRLGRNGHLFGARFGSREIRNDSHLQAALRYVARNPVEAGLCSTPAGWFWSSYSAVVGIAQAPSFLDVDRTLRLFGVKEELAREAFRHYVLSPAAAVGYEAGTYSSPLEAGV
jgi:putative transposase